MAQADTSAGGLTIAMKPSAGADDGSIAATGTSAGDIGPSPIIDDGVPAEDDGRGTGEDGPGTGEDRPRMGGDGIDRGSMGDHGAKSARTLGPSGRGAAAPGRARVAWANRARRKG